MTSILPHFFMTAKLISNCLFHFFGSCCHCRFLFVGLRPQSFWHAFPPFPRPLFLKHTMRFAVCVAAVGLVMATGAQVRRGALSAHKLCQQEASLAVYFFVNCPCFPHPTRPTYKRTRSLKTLSHTHRPGPSLLTSLSRCGADEGSCGRV